jgi:hypothetical protein
MKKLFLMICLCLSFSAAAHEAHQDTSSSLPISVAFDNSGKLWRVQVKADFVEVSYSSDYKQFSTPLKVNPEPQNLRPMGEVRPKIAIGSKGEIYVAWMQNLKPRFAGYIWFARSVDGGKTFEKPYVVHQDRAEISHAFEALQVSPSGVVTILWLDSRDLVAARAAGKTHSGSSIYYAVSNNQGASFQPEQKLADSSCECCRIATVHKPDGTVAALWRHVFEGNERDHMLAEVPKADQKPHLHRATYDHWKIDGCPHHGAALASGGEGSDWWGYHMAYFDGNDKKAGLYYTRMDGVAWASSVPKKFGNHKHQAGHPALLSQGEKVWLVWRESEDKKDFIFGMFSDDGGRNWQAATMLANASGKSDYPHLLNKDGQFYLVWNTAKDGLKVLGLQAK